MKRLNMRLEDGLHKDVKERAAALGVTMNDYAVGALRSRMELDTKKMIGSTLTGANAPGANAPKEKDENEKERSKEKGKEEKEQTKKTTARAREDLALIPTRQECRDYAKTNPAFDIMSVEQFYDYYDAIGWKFKGGKRVRNWKALMRNWARKEFQHLGRSKAGRAELAEDRRKRDEQLAREEAAKDPANWGLCAERCARFCEGKCLEGVKWPPQFNERPIPPEECRKFKKL